MFIKRTASQIVWSPGGVEILKSVPARNIFPATALKKPLNPPEVKQSLETQTYLDSDVMYSDELSDWIKTALSEREDHISSPENVSYSTVRSCIAPPAILPPPQQIPQGMTVMLYQGPKEDQAHQQPFWPQRASLLAPPQPAPAHSSSSMPNPPITLTAGKQTIVLEDALPKDASVIMEEEKGGEHKFAPSRMDIVAIAAAIDGVNNQPVWLAQVLEQLTVARVERRVGQFTVRWLTQVRTRTKRGANAKDGKNGSDVQDTLKVYKKSDHFDPTVRLSDLIQSPVRYTNGDNGTFKVTLEEWTRLVELADSIHVD